MFGISFPKLEELSPSVSEPMIENVLGYLRNPCSLNRERDVAFAAKAPHAADMVLFGREI